MELVALAERISPSETGGSKPRRKVTRSGVDLPVHQPRVLGLSATAGFAPSPLGSAHAHGLAEKAGESRSVFRIVGVLVALRLSGAFGERRHQLAVRPKEAGRIGG